jgi:phosphoglycerate kinase
MAEMRSVRDAAVHGRRVLVRVDFNVPLTGGGEVADERRIAEAMPTLRHLQAAGAKTILMSHLGRPNGQRDMRYSLRPVVHKLSQLLGQPVPLAEDCVGMSALHQAARLQNGGFLMLENLRFHPGEEANDPAFALELAQLGELFVEEAFGTVHRAHASTVGVPKRLPAFAGFLVEREVRELSRLTSRVEPPFVALLGGAKVADKLPLLEGLAGRAHSVLLGGALAFPFLAARGTSLGASRVEPGLDEAIRAFLAKAERAGTRVELPSDWVAELPGRPEASTFAAEQLPPEAQARDVGPDTRQRFLARLQEANTVFWNGPLGKAEDPRFAGGTRDVLGGLVGRPGYRVCAGGDSARIAQDLGVEGAFQYVSTGGGAALEFVAGLELPGLAVISSA